MDVTVIGACVYDFISYSSRFPTPGETLIGSRFSMGFGGKGANQCSMARKLGASTSMIGKVGDDSLGYDYIQHFRKSGINVDYLFVAKDAQTSSANIMVTDTGENSIVHVLGAAALVSSHDIIKAEKIIQQSKILLCTFECAEDALLVAMKCAKRHGVKIVVNGAPSRNYNLYEYVDIFCVNETEAEDATKHPVKNMDDVHTVAKMLLDKGCQAVIITLGNNGAILVTKQQPNIVHIPTESVKPVDTTGAGDAFVGSLVYYLAKNSELTLQDMITRSCAIATKSVLASGTQSSFPHRKDLPNSLFS